MRRASVLLPCGVRCGVVRASASRRRSPPARRRQLRPRPSKLADSGGAHRQGAGAFKAKFDTSKGPFVIEVHRDWAPLGADRFYNLVKNGFFDGVRFFRVIPNFMAQFGINGNPAVDGGVEQGDLKDDPADKQSNKRGFVTFGTTRRPEHARRRRSSSTTRTTRSSTRRASRRSARSSRAWTSSTS